MSKVNSAWALVNAANAAAWSDLNIWHAVDVNYQVVGAAQIPKKVDIALHAQMNIIQCYISAQYESELEKNVKKLLSLPCKSPYYDRLALEAKAYLDCVRGHPVEASRRFKMALSYGNDDPRFVTTLRNFAGEMLILGCLDEALDRFRVALAAALKSETPHYVVVTATGLAKALLLKNRLLEAREAIYLALRNSLGTNRHRYNLHISGVPLAIALHDLPLLERCFDPNAMRIAMSNGIAPYIGTTAAATVEYILFHGKRAEAKRLMRSVLKRLKTPERAHYLLLLIALHGTSKDVPEAREMLQGFLDLRGLPKTKAYLNLFDAAVAKRNGDASSCTRFARRAARDFRELGYFRREALCYEIGDMEQPQNGLTGRADVEESMLSAMPSQVLLFASLSPRERQIASLVAEGLTNREIASAFGISEGTVESHLVSTFSKLGINSRTRLATLFLEHRHNI